MWWSERERKGKDDEKKGKEERKEGRGRKRPNAGFGPATSCSATHVTTVELPPPDIIARTIYIANLDFHDLTVTMLAPPNRISCPV